MERAEGVDTHNNSTPRVLFHRQCLHTIIPLNPHINTAGVFRGINLRLTLCLFALITNAHVYLCFSCYEIKTEQGMFCFFSAQFWSTNFSLSSLRNARQSSTHVEVKTKLQHGQNKGVKHCWGSCCDRGGTWSASYLARRDWRGQSSASRRCSSLHIRTCPGLIPRCFQSAELLKKKREKKKTRVKVTSLIYEHDYESPDATFPNKPQTFTANNQ